MSDRNDINPDPDNRSTPLFGKAAKREPRRVVLLRVGIDTGSGGMLGPLFAHGDFDFVPITADRDHLGRTYGGTKGRSGRKLIEYFPKGRKKKMAKSFLHLDPEFKTFTYGDPTGPKQKLKNVQQGDLLVLYAGLKGWGDCTVPAGLYIIGYFNVQQAGTYRALKRQSVLREFENNWHILNDDTGGKRVGRNGRRTDLILIKGGPGSKLLKKAIRISARKRAKDRGGHPLYVLDPKMQCHFGTFTKINGIQRSIPRWVKPEFCDKAVDFVRSLN